MKVLKVKGVTIIWGGEQPQIIDWQIDYLLVTGDGRIVDIEEDSVCLDLGHDECS